MTMRQEEDYPYPRDIGRTHYDGCWQNRKHHNCAVAEADNLRALLLRHRWNGYHGPLMCEACGKSKQAGCAPDCDLDKALSQESV